MFKSYGVGVGCHWIIMSALVLFLSFEIRDGPGPELDNTIKRDVNNGKTSQILVIIGYLS